MSGVEKVLMTENAYEPQDGAHTWLMKIEMLDIINSVMRKGMGSFLTLAPSIGLQLGRRRSAGRGLERRP
jgi:hypothetical protein